jgi:UDP-3-O-acyl-N-acetylglucosamine deacetylase
MLKKKVQKAKKRRKSTGSYAAQLKYLIITLQFLAKHPYSKIKVIVQELDMSESSFYRQLKLARAFGMIIEICDNKDLRGYLISGYGIFDKNKLLNWAGIEGFEKYSFK